MGMRFAACTGVAHIRAGKARGGGCPSAAEVEGLLRRACHQQPHIGFPAAFAGVGWCVSDVQRPAAWVVRPAGCSSRQQLGEVRALDGAGACRAEHCPLQQSEVCMEDSKVLQDTHTHTHVGAPHGCWSCLLRAVLQWLWFSPVTSQRPVLHAWRFLRPRPSLVSTPCPRLVLQPSTTICSATIIVAPACTYA